MKTKIIHLLATLLTAGVVLTSCSKRFVEEEYHENYIQNYCIGEKMVFAKIHQDKDPEVEKDAQIYFYLQEKSLVTPQKKELFDLLAERNGDTGYNRMVVVKNGGGPLPMPTAYAQNFRSVHVTSDTDWDASHPAGTPLDDLLRLEYHSHAGFVRSGYTDTSRHCVATKISELTPADLEMIERNEETVFIIRFLDAPAVDAVHTLTIEMTTTEGEVLSGSIRIRPERYVSEK